VVAVPFFCGRPRQFTQVTTGSGCNLLGAIGETSHVRFSILRVSMPRTTHDAVQTWTKNNRDRRKPHRVDAYRPGPTQLLPTRHRKLIMERAACPKTARHACSIDIATARWQLGSS
jgi:hypothetical protein